MIRQDKAYNDGAATAGGVAIAVPQKWSCKRVDFKHSSDKAESLMAIIIPTGGKPLKVATCYNKPKQHFPGQLLTEFTDLKFNGSDIPGIFAGDLNSSHTAFGSRFTNVYGRSLLQTINNKNLAYFNDGSPTFIGKGELNVLDIVIGSPDMSRLISSCTTGGDIGSDHLPTITCLKLESSASIRKSCNIKEWASSLDQCIAEINFGDATEVENDLQTLEDIFVSTKEKCERIVSKKRRNLPPEIMILVRERKDLMKKRRKAHCEQYRISLNQQYNSINHKLHSAIEKFDMEEKEKLATEICEAGDSGEMWRKYNNFKRKNEDAVNPVSPLQRADGSWTESDQEKCDEFGQHLQMVHQTLDNPLFDSVFKEEIDIEMNNYSQQRTKDSESIPGITINQFRELLSMTKRNSASGSDCLTYDVMKLCNDKSIQAFCTVINNCLKENIFPSSWKKAKVIMLPKPGRDSTKACNYRPISLLSCFGKIFERYLHNHLIQVLHEKEFFNKYQAGFSKGRSPQEHIFCLTQDTLNGFKERKCTVAAFLDAQAAFDSVWSNGLKFKIKRIGLPAQLENILFSFLDDRSLIVDENGSKSSIVNLNAGTPQGSCLSPVLYLIYVNDLSEDLNHEKVQLSQYADDVSLRSTHSSMKEAFSRLQEGITALESWCKRWQVILNPAKSKVLVFTRCPRHEKEGPIHIRLFNEDIQTAKEVEFLGVVFDSYMTWEPQNAKIISKAYNRLNLLRVVAGLTKKKNPSLLVKLYRSIILSLSEYASVGIISAADCHIEKLQLLQNQAMRTILSLPAYIAINDLHDASGLNSVKSHLIKFSRQRLASMRSSSPLINQSINSYAKVRHIQTNSSPLDIIQLL